MQTFTIRSLRMWWRKSSGPYCEWELQFKEAIHFSTCVSKMMQVLFCFTVYPRYCVLSQIA